MEELNRLKQHLTQDRPQAWDDFPDIGLYMDQIISYMPRQLINFNNDELLTSAMVNNYIKCGLLPRAEGKRYSRTHLAYLTAICALKQVLSVKEVSTLLSTGLDLSVMDGKRSYARFCAELDAALNETAQVLTDDLSEADLPTLALGLALRSYADKLACQQILALLQQRLDPMEKLDKKSEKKSKK